MNRERIVLVADDEERIRRLVQASLSQRGYEVVTAANGAEAIAKLDDSIDLVLTDIKMPKKDGFAVLEKVRESGLGIPVLMMTAFGTVDSAVKAMKQGAYDYIAKPFDLDELEILVDRALDADTLKRENSYLKAREAGENQFEDMIGSSPAMQELFAQIRKVAATRSGVLISGETGAGKELVARAIHSLSPRKDKLFVPMNCAAIPFELLESELFGHSKGAFTGATENRVGRFELASGGTLFLDEIGDMDLRLQAKILRILEEGVLERIGSNRQIHIDTRVISATHRNLEEAIEQGKFRSDLYYRLNIIHLKLPSLRERSEDIGALAASFLEKAAKAIGRKPLVLDTDALELLESYHWPGNVRELRNVCERLTALCESDKVSSDIIAHLIDLPPAVAAEPSAPAGGGDDGEEPRTLAEAVNRAEVAMIEKALARSGDNKAQAAKMLGISERNLWYKIKKHGAGGESGSA